MRQSRHRLNRTFGSGDQHTLSADVLGLTECAALRGAVLRANPQKPHGLVADALEWARSVRLHALLLDMVLAGEVDIVPSADGTDLAFRERGADNVVVLSGR